MRRVLILGGSGMLGHKLWQALQHDFETFATVRSDRGLLAETGLFDSSRVINNVCATDMDSVTEAIARVRPFSIVNCIGVVKQVAAASDKVATIAVNALFPHRLARLARIAGARLITFSTDCVFSGKKGGYRESDQPDAQDLYGRSKLLGELDDEGCLTIRTSMIGRQLDGSHGLVEWFLSQEGKKVKGYTRARFSGLATPVLAEIVKRLLVEHEDLSGVFHVAAEPISKYDLLCLVKQISGASVDILPDDSLVLDRSLIGERFQSKTGIVAPPWPAMVERLIADPTPYTQLREIYANR